MPSKTSPSEINWNPDSVHALGLCKILTEMLGIWPLDCQSLFSKARLFIVVTLQVSMGINLIRAIRTDCVTIDDIVDSLALLGASAMATLKMIVLRINRAPMEFVISSILEDWSKVENTESREIMKSHSSTGRFVFIFQLGALYAAIASVIIGSLSLNNNKQSINNFTRIYDSNYSSFFASSATPIRQASENAQRPLIVRTACSLADLPSLRYYLVYVTQCIQLIVTGTGNIGTDVYFFTVALQVCAQFELLTMKFVQFGQYPNNRKNYNNDLRTLVKRHKLLITLSNNFEDIFNVVLFAQLFVNTVYMCLSGIRVLLGINTGDSVAVVSSLLAICVLSLQLFLYSYAGDYLSTQNEKISDAVYYCRWYDLPPTVAKDLMFVMSRSNRPFHLTAGKVYHINMDNFKKIFKTMASYFSMLRIMFEK